MTDKIKSGLWDLIKVLFAAVISFLLTYITFYKQFDSNEKARFSDSINKILDVNMHYPFVANEEFIGRWSANPKSHSDSSIQYQTYCIYVFNFLQDMCEYYAYNNEKINRYIDVNDLVLQHKVWWDQPEQQNGEGYPPRFRTFIGDVFKRADAKVVNR